VSKATCSIDGCDRPVVGRGWCSMHWQRWKTHGDPGGARSLREVPTTGHRCTGCGEAKGPEEFYLRSGRPGSNPERKPMSRCKACLKASSVAWQAGHRERMREVNSAYAKRNARRRKLYTYGLTEAELAALEEEQGGACRICGDVVAEGLVIDHCHREGHVRGLLCGACNLGLGAFRNDPARLAAAIRYLAAPSATGSQPPPHRVASAAD